MRSTSYVDELSHVDQGGARIERIRIKEAGEEEIRFSWWKDGRFQTRPLDLSEDDLFFSHGWSGQGRCVLRALPAWPSNYAQWASWRWKHQLVAKFSNASVRCGCSIMPQLRLAQGRGPGDFTETCDADAPRLIVHADTTPANVHEAMRTEPIHDALAAKGLAPSEHLADAGYVSAGHIVTARERHGVDLIGPRGQTRAGKSKRRARSVPPTSRWTGGASACAARRATKAPPGVNTRTMRQVSPTPEPGSVRRSAGPARRGRAAGGPQAAGSACFHARSTRRSQPLGQGCKPKRAGASMDSAEVSRSRSHKV